jgi:anti-sigma regulatory factor (Ser/Thr protein kinase)
MIETPTGDGSRPATGLRHILYPYEGDDAFLRGSLAYVGEALSEGALVVISVSGERREALREGLAAVEGQERVSFMDAASVGSNPARLIPAWQQWIGKQSADGQEVRAIGENRWNGRSQDEAGELRYHEWLLNQAFAKAPMWWLLCPYDTAGADPEQLAALQRCHPMVLAGGRPESNTGYVDEEFAFAELAAGCDPDRELAYGQGDLHLVREKVAGCAARCGLSGSRLADLLVAATEIAANSIQHGGGTGTLRAWRDGATLICEFHDAGHIADPLVGRLRPPVSQDGGRGLWLANQLCDLVQIRSRPETGTTVRLHTYLA